RITVHHLWDILKNNAHPDTPASGCRKFFLKVSDHTNIGKFIQYKAHPYWEFPFLGTVYKPYQLNTKKRGKQRCQHIKGRILIGSNTKISAFLFSGKC